MKDVIVTALANAANGEKSETPVEKTVVGSEQTERMAAFFATEDGSKVLYEAVKNFMSTPEGITIVENAIVAAIARRDWRDIPAGNRRRTK